MHSISELTTLHNSYKETSLNGRYITSLSISPLIENLPSKFEVSVIGNSVNGLPIHLIKIGRGSKKILLWSQMHGNESTSTKALFDLLNTFEVRKLSSLYDQCALYIIPMLNPDGSNAYTRLNAVDVDLNRDAQDLSQPESKALRSVFDTIQPDYCFNLHGQRTIFSAGSTNKAATLSFLAPAEDVRRTVTGTRKKAMEVIVGIDEQLQKLIPEQIGRYDDGFNLNCVGDTFQTLQTPTILFEAGHYNNDYERESVRYFMYCALVTALEYISDNKVLGNNYKPYFSIPENKKLFYDVIVRNASIDNIACDIAFQYKEALNDNGIEFHPIVEKIENLSDYFGHKEIDAKGEVTLSLSRKNLNIGELHQDLLIGNEKFSLKFTNC